MGKWILLGIDCKVSSSFIISFRFPRATQKQITETQISLCSNLVRSFRAHLHKYYQFILCDRDRIVFFCTAHRNDSSRMGCLRQSIHVLEAEGLKHVNGIFMFSKIHEGRVCVIIANNSRLTGSYQNMFIRDER